MLQQMLNNDSTVELCLLIGRGCVFVQSLKHAQPATADVTKVTANSGQTTRLSALPGSVGVDNTENNRRDWRELLYTAPDLGKYISGAIMFEETLYQSCADGKPFVDVLRDQGIMPGIKVDGGLEVSTLPDAVRCVSARKHGQTSCTGYNSWSVLFSLKGQAKLEFTLCHTGQQLGAEKCPVAPWYHKHSYTS